jgi:hypothetical protein
VTPDTIENDVLASVSAGTACRVIAESARRPALPGSPVMPAAVRLW